jgi:hypothetical protein
VGKKRKRDHGSVTKKDFRRSLVLWLVVCLIIVIALSGWSWLSARQPISENVPETMPENTVSLGIVDQFYNQNPSFTDHLVQFLEQHDVTYNVHKDAEVTVELYRNLPTFEYKLIILRVHAGILKFQEEETALFTSEEYNTYDYWAEQFLEQVGSGFMGETLEDPVFTINPRFVTERMEGDFGNATIVLSSCWGLHNNILAEAFIEKGASTFIGWDERVELEHTDRAVLALLDGLISEELTVEEAVDKVMEEVGVDRLWRCTLKYYPYGNVHIFL